MHCPKNFWPMWLMILQRLFPNASLVHSTLFIQNGNFRAIRKIVVASLAQSGLPPCYFEKSTYNMLVNPTSEDLRGLDKECHLTSTEREHTWPSHIRKVVTSNPRKLLRKCEGNLQTSNVKLSKSFPHKHLNKSLHSSYQLTGKALVHGTPCSHQLWAHSQPPYRKHWVFWRRKYWDFALLRKV